MKVWNSLARMGVAALVLAGVTLTGCQDGGGERRWPSSGWVGPEWDAPSKPAPKPAPVAAKPAPAPAQAPTPAPVAAPVMAGDVICLPTGDRATSTICLRCNMPREVIAGTNFDYTIEVCNVTRITVQNVMVNYSLDGARIVSSDPAATGSGFAIGDLGAGQCKTIKITANAPGTGSVRGCMGATWNNSLCCSTNVVQPALRVVKSVTPAEGTPCDTFTYKVTVTNTGTGAASNVKLTDALPAGVTSNNQSSLNWDIGTLAAGQSRDVTFSAKAGRTGSFVNFASATADNNLSARSNDVSIVIKQPSLQIAKTCPGTLRVGRAAAFKITVSNKGDAPATGTVVEDTVPAGSTFVSATDGGTMQGGKVVWNLGTLAPGATKELGLTLNVSGMGTMQNNVSARCVCAETVSANCSFSVQGSPDLGTLLDDADGVVLVGTNHTY
ncbi:MAG: CARDB domain-containing protein, partial [Phycisphaerales bacterium]